MTPNHKLNHWRVCLAAIACCLIALGGCDDPDTPDDPGVNIADIEGTWVCVTEAGDALEMDFVNNVTRDMTMKEFVDYKTVYSGFGSWSYVTTSRSLITMLDDYVNIERRTYQVDYLDKYRLVLKSTDLGNTREYVRVSSNYVLSVGETVKMKPEAGWTVVSGHDGIVRLGDDKVTGLEYGTDFVPVTSGERKAFIRMDVGPEIFPYINYILSTPGDIAGRFGVPQSYRQLSDKIWTYDYLRPIDGVAEVVVAYDHTTNEVESIIAYFSDTRMFLQNQSYIIDNYHLDERGGGRYVDGLSMVDSSFCITINSTQQYILISNLRYLYKDQYPSAPQKRSNPYTMGTSEVLITQ